MITIGATVITIGDAIVAATTAAVTTVAAATPGTTTATTATVARTTTVTRNGLISWLRSRLRASMQYCRQWAVFVRATNMHIRVSATFQIVTYHHDTVIR